MTADHDLAAARVIEELGAISDPPADLHAARLELQRRTRRVIARRRLALAAVVTTAAVLGVAVFRAMPESETAPLPARHLQSGLPVGILEGRVQGHSPGGQSGARMLRLVVRADATGWYRQGNGERDDIWPVRYVGDGPGRVDLKGRGWSCGKGETELTLDFIVGQDSITITHAVVGDCSVFPDGAGDLRGVVLRIRDERSL
jgi:hypothetical protein